MDIPANKDFSRPEGVYASIDVYPPEGGIGLVRIERVAGDCTVHSITIAPSEARSLAHQLKDMGFDEPSKELS